MQKDGNWTLMEEIRLVVSVEYEFWDRDLLIFYKHFSNFRLLGFGR